ncbi:MAG: hypothetical protein OXG23_13005 [Chloroflexi bacterium]|nr:hypothetical protein [Chloroflexota bacterium]
MKTKFLHLETEAKPTRFPRLRALLFLALALLFGVALVIAMTWFVIGSAPRSKAIAVAEDVTVSEFATLPDDDAYPAALAINAAGALYSGSYQSGALWSISPAGEVREIPASREQIGSVSGLDIASDGALYILDRIEPLDARGAVIWRYTDGDLARLFDIRYDDFIGGVLPDDIAVDAEDRIYISDRLGHVLRYSRTGAPLGSGGEPYWWFAPCLQKCGEVTGIAYDAASDELLIADPADEAIHRVKITDGQPGDRPTVYGGGEQRNEYGFDGISATPGGEIYIALLNWNRVARVVDGELVMLAKDFRGASDLAYDPARQRLYVSNWNQFSLAFGTSPQLPFAIDVIEFGAESE